MVIPTRPNILVKPTSSLGFDTKKESISQNILHRQNDDMGFRSNVERWVKTHGGDCPYLKSVRPRRKRLIPLFKKNQIAPNLSPSWNDSTGVQEKVIRKDNTKVQVFLVNQQYALHEVQLKDGKASKPLAIEPKPMNNAGLYGAFKCNIQSNRSVLAAIPSSPNKSFAERSVMIQVLNACGLHNPCSERKCTHTTLKPWFKVRIREEVQQSNPSEQRGTNPIWSKEKMTFNLKRDKPEMLELLIAGKCGKKTYTLGVLDIELDELYRNPVETCQFYDLKSPKTQKKAGRVLVKLSMIATAVKKPGFPFAGNDFAAELLGGKKKLSQTRGAMMIDMPKEIEVTEEEKREASVYLLEMMKDIEKKQLPLVNLLEIDQKHSVGEGIFAMVYCAHLKREPHIHVALKLFQYNRSPPPMGVMRTFRNEYVVLSSLNHPNVISLKGLVTEPKLGIITEFMNQGSLFDFMHKSKEWTHVSYEQVIQIAIDIAKGLAYLHHSNYVHRDIKSHNVLLHKSTDGMMVAKLGDFGSACPIHSDEFIHTEMGTTGYTAPEVFSIQGYNTRADVWSFGIILWELFAHGKKETAQAATAATAAEGDDGKVEQRNEEKKEKKELVAEAINPFAALSTHQFYQEAKLGTRPYLPETMSVKLQQLIRDCWEFDPEKRPCMEHVVARMEMEAS